MREPDWMFASVVVLGFIAIVLACVGGEWLMVLLLSYRRCAGLVHFDGFRDRELRVEG